MAHVRGEKPDYSIPDVSVVIPTLNRWEVLAGRGLRAALAQEGPSVEVVVVDDGSVRPAPMSPPFDDPLVRLLRHETNLGVAAARNTGIRASRGAWIAFLDDDDIWAPTKLKSVLQALDHVGADFGYSAVIVLDSALRPVRVVPAPSASSLHRVLRRHNAIYAGASSVVAKASLLRRVGNFDEQLSTAADWEMWLRLAQLGRAEAVNQPLVAYRPSSWLLDDEEMHRRDCERVAAKHPDVAVDWLAHERWVASSLWQQGRRAAAARRHAMAWLRHGNRRALRTGATCLLTSRRRHLLRHVGRKSAPDWIRMYT